MRTFYRFRSGRAAYLFFAAGAVLAALAGTARAATPPDISGIYVIGQKYFLPLQVWSADKGMVKGNGTLKRAVRNPGVDGVLIDLKWSDIAASDRKYDWSLLDYMARVVVETDKKFEIAIITGSSTPGWVFSAPPLGYGAQSATFDYIQSTKPNAVCAPQILPLPWDAKYLAAFGDLLDQLSRHLKKKGYYPNLVMLRITGINTLTDELRLPAQTPETTGNYTTANHCTVDNLQLWQSLGYRPALVRQAWRRMLRLYRRAFPDKVLNVALITAGGFPAFAEDGTPVTNPPATAKTVGNAMTTELVKEAGRELPGWFVVQSNGLVGDQQPDPATIKDALKAGAMLGWQTNEWLGIGTAAGPGNSAASRGGGACGGTRGQPVPCSASAFARMLTSGIYPNGTSGPEPLQAQYLELFPANIIEFPKIVMHAHDLLIRMPQPGPAD